MRSSTDTPSAPQRLGTAVSSVRSVTVPTVLPGRQAVARVAAVADTDSRVVRLSAARAVRVLGMAGNPCFQVQLMACVRRARRVVRACLTWSTATWLRVGITPQGSRRPRS